MSEKFLGLDLGSKNLKLCVAEINETGELNLLTTIKKEINSFRNGEIIDDEEFNKEVIGFLKDLIFQLGIKNYKIVLSFSSSTFNFQKIKAKTIVENRVVSEEDIKRCKQIARTSLISQNYETIYEETINYFLDNSQTSTRNPLGFEARYLEIELGLIQVFKSFFLKLQNFFKENKIKIDLFLPNPIGASYVVLENKDKESGCVLMDIGYKTTVISVFNERKLVNFNSFQFGYEDLIKDITLEYGISEIDWLKIVNEFLEDSKNKKSSLKIGKQKISYSNFLKFVEKRILFYFKKREINDYFNKLKENYSLINGVYLIGGLTNLPEIENIIKKSIRILTRKGKTIKGLIEIESGDFYNSFGNLNYFLKNYQDKGFWEDFWGFFKNLFSNFFPFSSK
ncbi:MAG: hypothetical protein C4348_00395 [Patescibacteria group bacterium]